MKYLYTLLLIGFTYFGYSQNTVGLYVDNFKDIIGIPTAETALLNYAQSNGFNYLILYNLSYINTHDFAIDDYADSLPLANFIANAKTNYGILQVAAVGEKNASFDKIKVYNSFYPSNPEKRFDVFNLEFEFWNSNSTGPGDYYCTTYLQPNGYTCDEAGAFSFYIDQLAMMYAYGSENGILIETYIGYVNQTQADLIVQNTHRVLVHYYRQSDVYNNNNSIYQYHPDRITFLATGHEVTVMPIFSARTNHMYNWLIAPHPLTQPYNTWLNGQNGFNSQSGSWTGNINVAGYVWYRYSDLLNVSQTLATDNFLVENQYIKYNPILKELQFHNFNNEDEVKIYAITGVELAKFKVVSNKKLTKISQKGVYIVQVHTKNGVISKKMFF